MPRVSGERQPRCGDCISVLSLEEIRAAASVRRDYACPSCGRILLHGKPVVTAPDPERVPEPGLD